MTEQSIDTAIKYLPRQLETFIAQIPSETRARITEIRLRRNSPVSLVIDSQNVFLNSAGKLTRDLESAVCLEEREIAQCVSYMCAGSYQTQADNIKRGFITLPGGLRTGVCGETSVSASGAAVITQITGLNLRIPHFIHGPALPIVRTYCSEGAVSGTLIYSVPGEGKTTLLRDLIYCLSKGIGGLSPRRTAVIDTRREIYMSHLDGGLTDFLSGYPKAEGIELAVRTMNPEVLVCDEIGGIDRIGDIKQSSACGVPLIATAHAGSYGELRQRDAMRVLADSGVFKTLVQLYRERGEYKLRIEGICRQKS